MNSRDTSCPSWDHSVSDVPVDPGHITCAQHLGQELRILKIFALCRRLEHGA